MTLNKIIIVAFLVILSIIESLGQSNDSIKYDTPLRKGRWMAILHGIINSGTVIRPDSTLSNQKFSNNYSFAVSGYKFIIDRLGIGLAFTIQRTGTEEYFIKESETFNVGPSFRYYLANQIHGGPFAQTGIIYSRFYDRVALLDIQYPVDRVLKGSGPGLTFGLGYDYVFKDILSLEIGFDFTHAWLSGETVDQITTITNSTNFRRFSFSFSFGLGILIGKQK